MIDESFISGAVGEDMNAQTAAHDGMDANPEYFDVLDENGEKTGRTKLRQEVHRDGDWHRSVDVFVVRGDELLLQKRCATKDSYPDMWDLSCGGHISAGESSLETAVRVRSSEFGLEVCGEFQE